jgi:hypothetical protein
MTLGDLLTLLRESILNDRTDRVAGSSDYLWSDATLCTFINEAQRKFAVESFILRDGTTNEATLIPLVAGQTIYDLHPAIMSVMSAQTVGRTAALNRVGHSLFTAYRTPSESWVDPQNFDTLQPGETLAFSTDEALNDLDSSSFSQVTMRIWPAPSAAMATAGAAIRLRVVRKPLQTLVPTALGAVPELPEDHHIEMLDWAAYLALRIVDDDAGAPKRADEFAARFDVSVTKARKLAMRKMFAPMGWGFGRGGFTWER